MRYFEAPGRIQCNTGLIDEPRTETTHRQVRSPFTCKHVLNQFAETCTIAVRQSTGGWSHCTALSSACLGVGSVLGYYGSPPILLGSVIGAPARITENRPISSGCRSCLLKEASRASGSLFISPGGRRAGLDILPAPTVLTWERHRDKLRMVPRAAHWHGGALRPDAASIKLKALSHQWFLPRWPWNRVSPSGPVSSGAGR